MKAGLSQLGILLEHNVLEIRFIRRREVDGRPPTRRMLCTNSAALLNSLDGRATLNYRTPIKGLRYNPSAKGVVLTWDILMQDFRAVSTDSCEILTIIPDGDDFWNFFNETLLPMSPDEKTTFMNQ